ncbi:MAG TPA: sugar ABC transporter ATP-binding protein [Ramlibacter sp.]|nr:sugar ABC transporter ATP-binding protein [Ramlibacter sp.]
MPAGNAPAALAIRGLCKRFGATQALADVDLLVREGEIHSLIGENGSGKSTLVKILCGYHTPDAGQITLWGSPMPLPVPKNSGIAVVHQDLGLVDSLSVLENIAVIDGFGGAKVRPVPWQRLQEEVRSLLRSLEIDVPLHANAGQLTRAHQALVAIARALRQVGGAGSDKRTILILDEPTASLSSDEARNVFRVLRQIAARGGSVVYISHKLQEVCDLSDQVTVLRDGHTVENEARGFFDVAQLGDMMIGGRLASLADKHAPDPAAPVVLDVRGITGGSVSDVSFQVRAGHVMGVTGLVGMGQDDIAHLIYGSLPARSGAVHMRGQALSPPGIRESQRHGLFVVPADRRGEGIWVDATAQENLALPLEGRLWRGWRDAGAITARALEQMRALHVRPLDPARPMWAFSGGNQQKVLLGKWLQMRPAALVLHEPTQGVDVGAKREIHETVRRLADSGVAICVCSSDHDELVALCDEVTVLRHGSVTHRLAGDGISLASIIAAINHEARNPIAEVA